MAAYFIVNLDIRDPERFETYRQRVAPLVEEHGGRYLVRGGAHEVIEGDWNPERIVVVEFPSVERAHEWYRSAEYQELAAMRMRAAPSQVVLVEGVA